MSRVLFIGVDAADCDLVAAWAEAGHLPTFRRLREIGARIAIEASGGVIGPVLHPRAP
jgi:hypothetical protein